MRDLQSAAQIRGRGNETEIPLSQAASLDRHRCLGAPRARRSVGGSDWLFSYELRHHASKAPIKALVDLQNTWDRSQSPLEVAGASRSELAKEAEGDLCVAQC